MWSNKYGRGPMSPLEFIRSPAGTVGFYECNDRQSQKSMQELLQASTSQYQARIKNRKLNAFNSEGEPCYLVRAEVLAPGRPAKNPTRKDSIVEEKNGVIHIRDKRRN